MSSSNDDDVVLIMVPCGGRSPKTINLSPTSSRLLSVVGLFVDCCCGPTRAVRRSPGTKNIATGTKTAVVPALGKLEWMKQYGANINKTQGVGLDISPYRQVAG